MWSILYGEKHKDVIQLGPFKTEAVAIEEARLANQRRQFRISYQPVLLMTPEHKLRLLFDSDLNGSYEE